MSSCGTAVGDGAGGSWMKGGVVSAGSVSIGPRVLAAVSSSAGSSWMSMPWDRDSLERAGDSVSCIVSSIYSHCQATQKH